MCVNFKAYKQNKKLTTRYLEPSVSRESFPWARYLVLAIYILKVIIVVVVVALGHRPSKQIL